MFTRRNSSSVGHAAPAPAAVPINPLAIPHTPCYLLEEAALARNLHKFAELKRRTGIRVLLALKGYSLYSTFPTIAAVLDGVSASSLNEARLGAEEFDGSVHVYSPAYSPSDIAELVEFVQHIVFNSVSQWNRFKTAITSPVKEVHCGIRINPRVSTASPPLYDPCAPFSRFGVPAEDLPPDIFEQGVSGLHLHALCDGSAEKFQRVWNVVRRDFDWALRKARWLNIGGGHSVTHSGYNTELFVEILDSIQSEYALDVYMEPGEAVGWQTGSLVATVLDCIVRDNCEIAILDTSATAHMPDVLEMPYRPQVRGAMNPGELPHTYRLAGVTCLAGDVIGDYSFAQKLSVGDRVEFLDMMHYTMVKNTTFNGIPLPSIGLWTSQGRYRPIRSFTYSDFKSRLS